MRIGLGMGILDMPDSRPSLLYFGLATAWLRARQENSDVRCSTSLRREGFILAR